MKERELRQYSYLNCRDFGHAWEADGVVVDRSHRPLVYRRHLVCQRCFTTRFDRITVGGDRSGRYEWPKDYALGKLTKLERKMIRVVNVKREV